LLSVLNGGWSYSWFIFFIFFVWIFVW
jgi:hypothetical protein